MSDRENILEAFLKLRSALLSNDIPMLKRLITEDYIGYDFQGNPQDFKKTLEAYQPGCVKLDRYDVEDVEVRIIGDAGVITGTGYIQGTFAEFEFEHSLRFMDIYILRDSRWQFYLSQVTPLQAK